MAGPCDDRVRRADIQNVASSGGLVAADLIDGIAIFSGHDLRAGTIRTARVTVRSFAARPIDVRLSEVEATDARTAGVTPSSGLQRPELALPARST